MAFVAKAGNHIIFIIVQIKKEIFTSDIFLKVVLKLKGYNSCTSVTQTWTVEEFTAVSQKLTDLQQPCAIYSQSEARRLHVEPVN